MAHKYAAEIERLLAEMTLEEKIGQMNQYTGFFDVTGPAPNDGDNKLKYEDIKHGRVGSMLNVRGAKQVREMQKLAVENSRLGIPLVFAMDVIHGHKTIFPIPLAEAASWDLDAIQLGARIAAIEASAEGIQWTFAPMIDISRDPRWGRVMEGAGEDPYLGTQIALARIRGFQGEDLSDDNTVAACAKHFVGYGFAEGGKDYNTVDVGTSTLYNILLPPFKAAAEAGVSTFMNSFNVLNGIPATGDKFLQRDILKGKWKYDGLMVSDWGSIGEMIPHGYAKDGKQAALFAVEAGSDIDMESNLYLAHLKEFVESGEISIELIDDSVRRVLLLKHKLGLFEDPYKYCDEERQQKLLLHSDHLKAAFDVAKKSIVLLKNENKLLPLDKNGKRIAVIGPLADDKTSPLGNWRLAADDGSAISVIEGLEKYSKNTIQYAPGVNLASEPIHFIHELKINTTDRTGIAEAVLLAKEMEVVIMVMGEHGMQSGEGRSRTDIGLAGLQQELLEAVYAVNKNIVLVLMNGRPLTIDWAADHIPAIVEAWHLGSRSGDAIAEILFGDYNPSGKLPMTFPRSVGQIPIYYNHKNTGRPGPEDLVFWSHYIDEQNAPLYPFGHGLSYSDFVYKNLQLHTSDGDSLVTIQVDVHNVSSVDGHEVVQLYIRDHFASVTRPIKELKGFEKVFIEAGTFKTLQFELGEDALGFYNNQGQFVLEPGMFDVMVGGSSNTELTASFEI